MNQTNYIIYGEKFEFEDVILCAFRYSIYRKTYMVDSMVNWIKDNSHLLNARMVGVIDRDLRECLDHYKNFVNEYTEDIDYKTLISFSEWFNEFKKGYEQCTK